MSDALNRNMIMDCKDIAVQKIEVPEWGGHIYLRTLSGAGRDAWEYCAFGGGNREHASATLVYHCAVDEKGRKLFSVNDIAGLSQKAGSAISRLAKIIAIAGGLFGGATEQAEKNLPSDQSDDSGS